MTSANQRRGSPKGKTSAKTAAFKKDMRVHLTVKSGSTTVTRSVAAPDLAVELKKITRDLTPLQTHDLVTKGMGVKVLRRVMSAYRLLAADQVLKVIGTSERTLQRAAEHDRPLDPNVSDRALRLATVTSQAIDVLGSQEAAERWLAAPALGLDGRKPIDLLQSSDGTDLVKTLLTRMDYGVYT